MKKQYYKNDDPDQFRFFNFRTWKRMTEGEKAMWQESDDTPWEEESKLSKDESIKRMNATQKEKQTKNLRLQPGAKLDLLGSSGKILKWGPKFYLIEHWRKDSPESVRYGIMERLTADSSYGIRDILKNGQYYHTNASLEEAEADFMERNR